MPIIVPSRGSSGFCARTQCLVKLLIEVHRTPDTALVFGPAELSYRLAFCEDKITFALPIVVWHWISYIKRNPFTIRLYLRFLGPWWSCTSWRAPLKPHDAGDAQLQVVPDAKVTEAGGFLRARSAVTSLVADAIVFSRTSMQVMNVCAFSFFGCPLPRLVAFAVFGAPATFRGGSPDVPSAASLSATSALCDGILARL
jgi:hypothetical protein